MTQRSADGSIIDDRTYSHDDIGNITSVTTASETINYSYDSVYRLLNADSSINANDASYSYDDVGNRLTGTVEGLTYYYNYNNNGNRLDDIRLDSTTGTLVNSYDYDDNGSRIATNNNNGGTESYVYDQRRLISEVIDGRTLTSFSYDPNAYRIGKNTPTVTNYLLEGEHLEATYDENNQLKASYLRGVVVDEIINGFEKDANGELINRSYHHDQVNSVIATTDHTGASTQTNQYTPFGRDLSTTGSDDNALRYTGRERESNGLYYYRARYYDPMAGRFLSEDPIGFEAGVNFYAYVGNNPVRFNDPSGKVESYLDLFGQLVGVGGSVLGMGGGIVTTGLGVIMIAAPEPTMISVAGGVGLMGLGTATTALSIDAFDQNFTNLANNIFETNVSQSVNLEQDVLQSLGYDVNDPVAGGVYDIMNLALSIPSGRIVNNFLDPSFVTDTIGFASTALTAGGSILDSSVSIMGSLDISLFGSSNASGGFVIYPNKLNTNFVNQVYVK